METQRNNALSHPPQLTTPSRRFLPLPLALCIASALALPLSTTPLWAVTGTTTTTTTGTGAGSSPTGSSQPVTPQSLPVVGSQPQAAGNNPAATEAVAPTATLVELPPSIRIHAAAITALINANRPALQIINERARIDFKEDDTRGVWAQGFSTQFKTATTSEDNRNSSNSVSTTDPFATFSNSNNGLLVGGDIIRNEHSIVGGSLGVSKSIFEFPDAKTAKGNSNNFYVGLYGGFKIENILLRLGTNYTFHDIKTERTSEQKQNSAAYKGATVQGIVELAHAREFGAVTLEPFANLAWLSTSVVDFTETGHSATAINYKQTIRVLTKEEKESRKQTEKKRREEEKSRKKKAWLKHRSDDEKDPVNFFDSTPDFSPSIPDSSTPETEEEPFFTTLFSTIGIRGSINLSDRVKVQANLGWQHAFASDVTPKAKYYLSGDNDKKNSYNGIGVPIAKETLIGGIQLLAQVSNNVTISASYNGMFSKEDRDHGFNLGIGYAF